MEISISVSLQSVSACSISNIVPPVCFQMDLSVNTDTVKKPHVVFWLPDDGKSP
jgi:hypothetical protein